MECNKNNLLIHSVLSIVILSNLFVQRGVCVEFCVCIFFTDMNEDLAEGRLLSLNSWSGNTVQQSLIPNSTIPFPEYSSPMPHLEKESIPYTSKFCGLFNVLFLKQKSFRII